MVEPKVLEKRPKSSAKRVSLVARVEKAKSVSVTGDFTGWSAEGIPLSKGSPGDWETSLVLPPGEYQYRLRVDGQWQDHAQAQKRVRNSFGSENCVLTVEG
jgi:1,4-alpha-glucan branching enzyme